VVYFVVTGAKPNTMIGVVECTFNAEFTPNAAALPICPVQTAPPAPRTAEFIEMMRDSYPMYHTLGRDTAIEVATKFRAARPKTFAEANATLKKILAP